MVRRAEEIGLNRSADFAAACPRSKERQGDRQQSAPWPGTEGSNPPPSSGESANSQFLAGHSLPISGRCGRGIPALSLRERRRSSCAIAGAGLDVFEHEPAVDP